jgi:RNA polymerase sigma-70 factor (ECF subfamily)
LRWHRAERQYIDSPPAWLAKVVTNLSLTSLASARVRRERYVGTWLPEPVFTGDGSLDPSQTAERHESVSLALLVLLEQLSPIERGVYVLHEAFLYSYRDIAEVFDRSEANCRQILRRAVVRLSERRARFTPSSVLHRKITAQFLEAALAGDLPGLERLLAQEVTVWTDGAGRAGAARQPIVGRDRVARYLTGMRQLVDAGVGFLLTEVNGQPAVIGRAGDRVVAVMVVEIVREEVTALRNIVNPDKLAFLGRQLSHLAGLFSSGGEWTT